MAELALDPHRLDRPGVLALAQHPAGGHEAGHRKRPGPLAVCDIDDGVVDPVPEQGGGPGRGAAPAAQAQLDPRQPFGLQRRIGLGDVVTDAERPVQLVQGRGAESRIGRRARGEVGRDRIPAAQSGADHLARAVRGGIVQGYVAGGAIPLDPPSVGAFPAVQA